MSSRNRFRTVFTVAGAMFVIANTTLGQTILYVDAYAAGPAHNGSSWCDAYLTLHQALDAAIYGTTIRVADGTYRPNPAGLSDPREATFQLATGVTIEGGYAGCGAADPDERDIVLHETILSGDLTGSDDCYHVVTGSGTDPTAVLDGFTITGGHANGSSVNGRGAGMYNASGHPTITNCTFDANLAFWGGAMYNLASSPSISGCTFSDNQVTDTPDIFGGAGIYNNDGSSPEVTDSLFYGNIAGWNLDGGGMANENGSSPTVTNCIFIGNEGDAGGAIFAVIDSHPVVTDCVFIDNLAPRGGGAIASWSYSCPAVTNSLFHGNVSDGSVPGGGWGGAVFNDPGSTCSPTYVNCTFSGNQAVNGGAMMNATGETILANCALSRNSATDTGGGIHHFVSGASSLSNCIVWDNTPNQIDGATKGTVTVTYSNIQGGWSGSGNIDADPMFVDPDGEDNIVGTGDDNLRPAAGSPCIDAGDNTAVPEDISSDLDGAPRFADDPATPDTGYAPGGGPVVDMGPYEFADCNGNGVADRQDIAEGTSSDCNDNVVPDECEPDEDCNNNGGQDICDVADGTSQDCNGNDIPDECDIEDGTGVDCNLNGVPDECDIAGETSEDCNSNGVPDECDPDEDCNTNGIQDICDVAGGTSEDCNFNEVPDECEPDEDCNDNGTRDICDIGSGFSQDCNDNGIPDECDLDDGTSLDVNGNGIPDECENPPAPEPGGPACSVAGDCTGAYEGADCVGGSCYAPKNRYLSIDPTVNEALVAYQVTLAQTVDYPSALGRTWWVDEPACYDYPNGDVVTPTPSLCAGADMFGWVSKLTATPVTRVWTEVPLHITGCGIAPAVGYEIRTSADDGVTVAEPLEIASAPNPEGDAQSWGDITGGPVPDMPGLWLAPERATNLADVQAGIRTFENRAEETGFPPRVWVDVEINQVINLGDIQFIISAFEGKAYADIDLELIGIHPADCP